MSDVSKFLLFLVAVTFFIFGFLFASKCAAQTIATKPLTIDIPIRISLSTDLTTTLLFPGPLSGTFGLGLVTGQGAQNGTVQVDHPDGSNILVLHALSDTAHVLATVLLDGNLYDGYSKRDTQYTSDSGTVKTTVTTVHRFSKEDATVLQGVVENETDKPLSFDGRAATVLVASEVHPIKLLDCLRPIPPRTKTLIDVVIQGDIDGGRANLALGNEYRIMLPGDTGNIWSFKNGGSPGKTIPSKPLTDIPLTQTGKPKMDAQ